MTMVQTNLGEAAVVVPREPKEMISISRIGEKTKVRINYSSMDVIQNCLRKAQLLLHEKWKPAEEGPATLFGSGVHKGFEVFYSGNPAERKVFPLETYESMSCGHTVPGEDSELTLKAFRAFVNKVEPLSALPETDKRSPLNGAWIMWNYFKTFENDPYVAMVDEKGPLCERSFSLTLHEDDELIIEYFGTIDVVLQHHVTKEILVCDHKTTSFLGFGGTSYFDRARPAHQYSGYLLGAREVFGLDTNTFMVSIVEVKARPKTTKGQGPSFPRQLTTRDEADFAEFKDAVVYSVKAYLAATKTGLWPLGPINACESYGNCTYRTVCATPKGIRENVLNARFARENV